MNRILRWIFFHFRFWPRAVVRFYTLLFRGRKLLIHSVELDRAFYIEGGFVILQWEVENAWLIRVNHPGGFYHRTDSTWFSAKKGMEPIRISIRGLWETVNLEFPVATIPYDKQTAANNYRKGRLRKSSIHLGPDLHEKASKILNRDIQLNPNAMLFKMGNRKAAGISSDIHRVYACKTSRELDVIVQEMDQKYDLNRIDHEQ